MFPREGTLDGVIRVVSMERGQRIGVKDHVPNMYHHVTRSALSL